LGGAGALAWQPIAPLKPAKEQVADMEAIAVNVRDPNEIEHGGVAAGFIRIAEAAYPASGSQKRKAPPD
jgi:hypothetical protein